MCCCCCLDLSQLLPKNRFIRYLIIIMGVNTTSNSFLSAVVMYLHSAIQTISYVN